jgi:hypothetical protein
MMVSLFWYTMMHGQQNIKLIRMYILVKNIEEVLK